MASPVHGQSLDVELEEVVVTGTRTEKPLSEAPVRTEVVTREEIERMHARDLSQALENVPGLLLKETHGKQGQAVWMQGFDSNRVLILINGERLTATTGSTVDLTQISTANIERIEIVKGATSALYGSDAMGGVINVITKPSDRPVSLIMQVDGGSYGDANLDTAALNGALGAAHALAGVEVHRSRWDAQLSTDLRRSEGFDFDPTTYAVDGDQVTRWNVDTRLAFRPTERVELSLTPTYLRESKERPFSVSIPTVLGPRDVPMAYGDDVERWHVSAAGDIRTAAGSHLRTTLVHDRMEDHSAEDLIESPQVENERFAFLTLSRAEVQWDFPAGERHLMTMGVSAGRQTLEQEQIQRGVTMTRIIPEMQPNAAQSTYEGYVQDDITITPWLEVLPGLRYQYDSDFGPFVAPKINVLVKASSNVNVRLGYGKGYRAPNLKERFYFFDHSNLGYMVIGNPDLKPESSDSVQAGVELSNGGSIRGDLNVFYNRIKNLIVTELNPVETAATGLQIFDYQNVGHAVTQGAEASVGWQPWSSVGVKAGYTYLWAKDTDADTWLTQRPKHQVKGGLDLRYPGWGTSLSLRAIYQSEEYLDEENRFKSPGWTTVDAALNQAVGQTTTVFVGVNNIGDVHRDPNRLLPGGVVLQSADNRPPVGRFVYAGVRVAL
ncbi:MAG: TonB-dependent receptor plug domain-containing protein [Nitrospirota bacterium]